TCGEAALLVSIIVRTPCGVVLDLDVDSLVFVRMLYVRHGNYSKYFLKRCSNVIIQPIYAVIPGKRGVINKFNHGTRRVPSCSKPPQVLEDCSPLIRERTTSHFSLLVSCFTSLARFRACPRGAR